MKPDYLVELYDIYKDQFIKYIDTFDSYDKAYSFVKQYDYDMNIELKKNEFYAIVYREYDSDGEVDVDEVELIKFI